MKFQPKLAMEIHTKSENILNDQCQFKMNSKVK